MTHYSIDQITVHDGWADCVIEDATEIGKLMGFNIDHVYFSGFWSQGDGACFVGSLEYAKDCIKAIKEYVHRDKTVHDIAERWAKLQARYFYSLTATITHSGRYYHERMVSFEFIDNRTGDEPAERFYEGGDNSDENEAISIARDFMRWIYGRLEEEYNFQFAAEFASRYVEAKQVAKDARAKARELIAAIKSEQKKGTNTEPIICATLRAKVRDLLNERRDAQEERRALIAGFHYHDGDQFWDLPSFAKEFY